MAQAARYANAEIVVTNEHISLNKKILHKAIDLLSRREHSVQELRQKLLLRDFDLIEITPVMDYLLAEDYISDARYAESVFRTRVNKGYGCQYIQAELAQKGVQQSIINDTVNHHEIDWYQQAELVYNKRFGENIHDIQVIEDQKIKAKRIRFMQQRGFSFNEIFH